MGRRYKFRVTHKILDEGREIIPPGQVIKATVKELFSKGYWQHVEVADRGMRQEIVKEISQQFGEMRKSILLKRASKLGIPSKVVYRYLESVKGKEPF